MNIHTPLELLDTPIGLLPGNATNYEAALDEIEERLLCIPTPIKDLWDADKCPIEALPFLAWALSVDLWKDSWPESRKRQMCREALILHSLKGTIPGFEKHIEYADATLVSAMTPPQDYYWGDGGADASRRWKAGLPQLQIKPYWEPAEADGITYDVDSYDNYYWIDPSKTSGRGRRAYYVKDGVETEIEWLQGAGPFTPDGVERFGLPKIVAQDEYFYDNSYHDNFYYCDPVLWDKEILSIERAGLGDVVKAGTKVTDVEPDVVYYEYTVPNGIHAMGADAYEGQAYPDDVDMPLFWERFHLFTEGVDLPNDIDGLVFYDHYRYGIDPYRADLKVHSPGYVPESHVHFLSDGGFYIEMSHDNLWDACDAAEAAKLKRDQVFIDTNIYKPATFGAGLKFGEISSGQYIRAN